ncbi:GNAT family N-acetyltransferase [Jannaschia sp. 2305UL9-9]|uniref:GNAT family N-acetyltransferase n=1 Tax=Jannaschia sp. 2305UL9-9 TaxID=3121638 RepID=UPI0035297D1E
MTRPFRGREVRRASIADAEAALQELGQAGRCVQGAGASASYRADRMSDQRAAWIAKDDARPVGVLLLDDEARLDRLFVCPKMRGTGVAEALLAMLDNHALVAGLPQLTVRASQALRPYLLRRGWTEVPRSALGVAVSASGRTVMTRAPGKPAETGKSNNRLSQRLIQHDGSTVRYIERG